MVKPTRKRSLKNRRKTKKTRRCKNKSRCKGGGEYNSNIDLNWPPEEKKQLHRLLNKYIKYNSKIEDVYNFFELTYFFCLDIKDLDKTDVLYIESLLNNYGNKLKNVTVLEAPTTKKNVSDYDIKFFVIYLEYLYTLLKAKDEFDIIYNEISDANETVFTRPNGTKYKSSTQPQRDNFQQQLQNIKNKINNVKFKYDNYKNIYDTREKHEQEEEKLKQDEILRQEKQKQEEEKLKQKQTEQTQLQTLLLSMLHKKKIYNEE
jgi:Skp family chaperone for outer membrane proteins